MGTANQHPTRRRSICRVSVSFQFYFPWHTSGSVEPVLKELVRLKIAQLNNCFT